jgi:hypothetical protein
VTTESGPDFERQEKKRIAKELRKNKELVLRAFDALFNKRDYTAALGLPITFSTASISRQDGTGYSISSRVSRRP